MVMKRFGSEKTRFWKVYAHYRTDDSPIEYFAVANTPKEVRERFAWKAPLLKVFAVVEITSEEYWKSKGVKK